MLTRLYWSTVSVSNRIERTFVSLWGKELTGPIIVFGIVYLILCWVMVSGWRDEYRRHRLDKTGIVVQATVTHSVPRSGKVPAELKYEYRTVSGTLFPGSRFVSTGTQRSHPPGSIVRVKYLPDVPDFSRIEMRRDGFWRAIQWIGLFVITFMVLTIAVPVGWGVVTGRIFKGGPIFKRGAN